MTTEAELPKAASFPGSGILSVAPLAALQGSSSAAREAPYTPGQILAGKYRVERRIGEGAMGQVLAVTHLGLNETLAMKIIRPEARELPDVLSRFGKEAKLAARIKSEHVIRVLDVDDAEPMGAYLVMEYLEGQSLGELLEAGGPLPVQRAVDYVLQACEGLAAAHAMGVIHRDIKPENLFVTRRGKLEVVKLLDFGISKVALTGRIPGDDAPADQTRYVMGTPLYMSPEQIRSDPNLDARTDIWSMGAVLYELVTGETVFMAGSITEICANILESPAPRLPSARAAAYPALDDIIQRCLEKDPAQRYRDVSELARALLPLGSRGARAYAARASCILGAADLDAATGGSSPHVASPLPEPPLPEPSLPQQPLPSRTPGSTHGLWLESTWIGVAALLVLAGALITLAVSRAGSHESPHAAPLPAAAPSAPAVLPRADVPAAAAAPAGAAPVSVAVSEAPEVQPRSEIEPAVTEPAKARARPAVQRRAARNDNAPDERRESVALVPAPRLRLVEAPPSRLRLVEASRARPEKGNGDVTR